MSVIITNAKCCNNQLNKSELKKIECVNNQFQVKDEQTVTYTTADDGEKDEKTSIDIMAVGSITLTSSSDNVIPLATYVGYSSLPTGVPAAKSFIVSIFDCKLQALLSQVYATCVPGSKFYSENLGMVVWILNNLVKYTTLGISNNDIQVAIYTVLGTKICNKKSISSLILLDPTGLVYVDANVRFVITDAFQNTKCVDDWENILLKVSDPQFIFVLTLDCTQVLFLVVPLSNLVTSLCPVNCCR